MFFFVSLSIIFKGNAFVSSLLILVKLVEADELIVFLYDMN